MVFLFTSWLSFAALLSPDFHEQRFCRRVAPFPLIDVSLRLRIISTMTASPARPRDVEMAAESRDGKLRSGERQQLARSTGDRLGLVFDLLFFVSSAMMTTGGAGGFLHRWLVREPCRFRLVFSACVALSISFIRYVWCELCALSHVSHTRQLFYG